jgi:hypothetical protein
MTEDVKIRRYLKDYLTKRLSHDEVAAFVTWDDTKDSKSMRNSFASKHELPQMVDALYRTNYVESKAIAFALNSFKTAENRKTTNVSKIKHIVIDIDGNPDVDEYNKLMNYLDEHKIKTVFESESKNGYHICIPVDLLPEDKKSTDQFLDNMQKMSPGVDLSLKSLTSLIRMPDSLHFKDRMNDPQAPAFRLQTFPFNDFPTDEQIKHNSEHVKNLDIIELLPAPVVENAPVVDDIFFNKILASTELMSYIATLQNVQKHNVLFKNLALFVKNNLKKREIADELVKRCGHSEETLKGWLENKKITQVNYLELLKWCTNNKLEKLVPLIKEQLSSGDLLNNYSFFIMGNANAPNVYKVMTEHGQLFDSPKSFSQMVKQLYFRLKNQGLSLYDYFKISELDDKGKYRTIDAKDKILTNIMKDQLDTRTIAIDGERYLPTDEMVFERNYRTYLNVYRKADVRKQSLIEGETSFPNIERVLRHITVDETNYDWLLKWLAHIVQFPTTKLPTSVVLKGSQGSGKGIFYKFIIKYLFGDENVNQVSTDTFKRGWGDTFRNKLFVNFDEFTLIKGKDDEHIERLKSITSENEVTLSIKGQDSVKVENFCHFLFTSNKNNPIPLQKDDRRYTIFDQPKSIPLEYVDAIDPVDNPKTHEKEILHFYTHLMRVKVGYKDVVKALDNETKKDNIETNRNTVETFLDEVRDYDGFESFYDDYVENDYYSNAIDKHERKGYFAKDDEIFITIDVLFELYANYCKSIKVKSPMLRNNIGKELKKLNIRSKRINQFNKKTTCYYVIDLENSEDEE